MEKGSAMVAYSFIKRWYCVEMVEKTSSNILSKCKEIIHVTICDNLTHIYDKLSLYCDNDRIEFTFKA